MAEKEVDVRFGAQTGALDAALKELVGSISGATSKINADLAELAARSKSTEAKIDASATGIGGAFKRMASSVGSALSSVGGVLNSLYRNVFSVHTALVGLLSGGIVATVKGALETAAAIKDVGNAANASTTYIQEMRYAASQNGASAEALDSALIKLNKNLGEFRTTGAGPAADALKQLGLANDVTADKFANTDEAMDAVIRKLSEVPDASDRAAMAADLFGKAAGPKLAELLKTGEAGIQAAREEAQKLGLVLTEDMIEKADEADDKLNALWETLKTAGVKAIGANADKIAEFADYVTAHIPEIIGWFNQLALSIGEVGKQLGVIERSARDKLQQRLDALHTMRSDAEKSITGGVLYLTTDKNAPGSGFYSKEDIQKQIDDVVAQLDNMSREDKANERGDLGTYEVVGHRKRTKGVDPKGEGTKESPEVSLARSAAQQEIEIERDKELNKLSIWQSALESRRNLGTTSNWLYIAQARFIAEQEYEIRRAAIEREMAVENLKPQQRLQLQGELEQLELQHQARMADIGLEAERLKDEARQREVQAEKLKNDQIARDRDKTANDVESFTNRLLSGQLNAQTLLMALAQQAQQMVVKFIGQRVAAAIYGEQVETAAAVAGAATRTGVAAGAASAAVTLQKGKAQKSILTSAAETFANVYAYLSPYMGPFAAVPAGLAYAAVLGAGLLLPSAAGGTEVTKDGIHMLHEKEVVLPAKWSQRLASLADAASGSARAPVYPSLPGGGEDGGAGGSAGMFGRAMSVTIHAVDAAGVSDFFRRYGHEIGGAIHRMAADGHIKPA